MFKKILIPVNMQDTALAEKALAIAIDKARAPDTVLTVMTVAPGFGLPLVAAYFPENAVKKAMEEIERQLKAYISKKIPAGINVNEVLREGSPAGEIIAQASEDNVDLIIIPSHDKSLEQVLLGSVAAKVARHAHCPVLVVKGGCSHPALE